MGLRLGAWVISTNLIFLVIAGTYFVAISLKRLRSEPGFSSGEARLIVSFAGAAGLMGALIYGQVGPWLEPAAGNLDVVPYRLQLQFGSFGGYWGALLGGAMASLMARRPVFPSLDALVPGVIVGGAVARFADVLAGTNPGIHITLAGVPVLRCWGELDIASLLFLLYITNRLMKKRGKTSLPGSVVITFLVGYGALRFTAEHFRDTMRPHGALTCGQMLALAQTTMGLCLFKLSRATARILGVNTVQCSNISVCCRADGDAETTGKHSCAFRRI